MRWSIAYAIGVAVAELLIAALMGAEARLPFVLGVVVGLVWMLIIARERTVRREAAERQRRSDNEAARRFSTRAP